VKTIPMPQVEKRKLFSQRQEAKRKYVEGAFGTLQSWFLIVHDLGRAWYNETLKSILYECIILHNMIVEDERHIYANFDLSYDHLAFDISTTEILNGSHSNFQKYLQRRAEVRDKEIDRQLQYDLVEHIWKH